MQVKIFDLGLIDYNKALAFQTQTHTAVKNEDYPLALIFCQHNPVITIGRAGSRQNLVAPPEEVKAKKIQVIESTRGGDITYHGPGQLTVYPIFSLKYFKKDIHLFLRYLEETIMDILCEMGINGVRRPGLTGVWVQDKKIASIGISIKNWISFHGLSINIKKFDLENFNLIRPCGMDIKMTCLEAELGASMQIKELKDKIAAKFNNTLPEEPNCEIFPEFNAVFSTASLTTTSINKLGLRRRLPPIL
ncbi:MAG: lipoyl(octanoyl) transferase LipB [Candidatus Omnitrophica bacterium]|nr:lipoyl(octanoyl) transferase LipB [Candidatus Omnitrophota bacterium]